MPCAGICLSMLCSVAPPTDGCCELHLQIPVCRRLLLLMLLKNKGI